MIEQDESMLEGLTPAEAQELKDFYDELMGNMAKLNEIGRKHGPEYWKACGRVELEKMGFPTDPKMIQQAFNVLSQPDMDELRRLSTAYRYIQRVVEGTKHETSLYLNMLDKPELFLHYMCQAMLGGFILAKSTESGVLGIDSPKATHRLRAVPDLLVKQALAPAPEADNVRHNFFSAVHQGYTVVKNYLAELAARGGPSPDEQPLAPGESSKLVN